MRKLAKNERICPICGKIFRFKREGGKSSRRYCSKECSKISNRNKAIRRNKLGTQATLSLSSKSIAYHLYLIRNNIDINANQFISDKSKRDVVLDHMCYDEDYSIIREV